jgi:transcriptional regulator with XRE-family HTH domain
MKGSNRKKPNEELNVEDQLQKLAERIKKLRIENGYSSHETFAFEKNLPRAQYGRYEQGKDDLRFTSLVRVINALGVSMAEFFSEGFD